uniref:BAR domain-containing protein n=1 Tax=Elaeophora elaphi TaxID=1147741 RepID=A0A0R3RSH3_9BILA
MYPDKFRRRSKQLNLWKMITLASYYERLMDSTRPRNVRQAVICMRELDVAAYRIESTIETLDQITNEVNDEIGYCVANFKKSCVTRADALENDADFICPEESVFSGLYQLSVQLQKQEKAISDVADHFSEGVRLITGMHDNFMKHKSLLKKCRVFDVDILAFAKLVRLQCGKVIALAKERWSTEDSKTLPLVVEELKKIIKNFDDLRMVCKLIAPISLLEENDIAKLIYQAQKLRQILEVTNHTFLFTSLMYHTFILF